MPGEARPATGLDDRLAGAVWGHLVGDAMGVPYEFVPPDRVGEIVWGRAGTHHQPPGTWSDDGGLMLALLDSLLTCGFDLEDQGRRAVAWYRGPDYKPGPRFDVGNATSAALHRIQSGAPAAEAGGRGESDNGNGSLMRILPVALVGRDLPADQLARSAMRASAVTHGHPRAQVACAAYVLMAQALLAGSEPAHAHRQALDHLDQMLEGESALELQALRTYADRSGSGYVLNSLWSAWDAFTSSGSFAETIERAIAYGNDTDTTACVAGGLAGIRWGLGGIPPAWVAGIRGAEIVQPLIDRLLAARPADW